MLCGMKAGEMNTARVAKLALWENREGKMSYLGQPEKVTLSEKYKWIFSFIKKNSKEIQARVNAMINDFNNYYTKNCYSVVRVYQSISLGQNSRSYF